MGSEHVPQRPVFGNQGVSPPATGVSISGAVPVSFEVDRFTYVPPLVVPGGSTYIYGDNGETGLVAIGPGDLTVAGAITYSGRNVTIGPGYIWWATVYVTLGFPGTPPVIPVHELWNITALKTSTITGWSVAGGGAPVAYANGYSGATGQTLPLVTVSNVDGDPFNVVSVTIALEAIASASSGVGAL